MPETPAFDLLLRGATIVTCDPAMTVIPDGALGIRDGRIAYVGPANTVEGAAARETRELRDRILMPGLVNTHCHATDSLFRGLVEDLALEPWLQTVWTAERTILNPATCFLGARLGLAELALSGVTSVMDMFWHPEETVRAARRIGLRIATGGIFFDYPGMDGFTAERRRRDADRFFAEFADDPLVIPGVMPHGTYTVGPEALAAARDSALAHGGFFCTHAAETKVEQATIAERYGTTVIRHLDALGCLGPRTVLAHCIHLDDDEIAILARTGTHVAHNPVSNLKLASGFAPVPALMTAGVNVSLGTDGAISGNDIDPWLALRLAATLHKAATGDAAAVPTAAALRMATINGAAALGIADRTGSLEVGKDADLVLVSTDRIHAAPLFDPITHLVYTAGRADVTDVWVAGRPVVAGGRLLTDDVAEIVSDVRALQPKILASIGRG